MRPGVIATHCGDWVEPAAVFEAYCRGSTTAFWLDSGQNAASGMSYLGTSERTVIETISDGQVREPESGHRHSGTIFDFLRSQDVDVEPGVGAGSFQLGWVGWLGYELHTHTLKAVPPRHSRYPDAALMFVDRAIAFDHVNRRVLLVTLGESDEIQSWREGAASIIDDCRRPGASPAAQMGHEVTLVSWACSDAEYLERIVACQRSIANGDVYQLCLTMQAEVAVTPDPLDTYLALRALSPTHHGGYIRIGDVSLLSASPEQFLTVTSDGEIESRPIKGTRRRGTSEHTDAALRDELLTSEKERAENLMIVDLMRNDIGRVSEVGSVSVPALLDIESYAQVHQLVSTVRGTLARGVGGVDAVEACFPAGSMTGAPKYSAVALLDALERAPRGIYSGAFGYFGLDGRIELAMVIRSIVLDPDGATIGSG
ncbi:MAG: anthranilate synthase component I family protein [Terrimesophilobacter sp.]